MNYGPTVTLEQAAELMNVHTKTVVDDYINTCRLPAAKLGRGWVMLTEDVLSLIRQRIAQQTAERMRRVQPPASEGSFAIPRRRRRRVG